MAAGADPLSGVILSHAGILETDQVSGPPPALVISTSWLAGFDPQAGLTKASVWVPRPTDGTGAEGEPPPLPHPAKAKKLRIKSILFTIINKSITEKRPFVRYRNALQIPLDNIVIKGG